MADAPIEELEVQVRTSTQEAVKGIGALQESLAKLKGATKGGFGLKSAANGIQAIGTACQSIDGNAVSNLNNLANALQALTKFKDLKLSSSIGNQLGKIGIALRGMQGVNTSTLNQLTTSLQGLTAVGTGNLAPNLRQLKKIPEIMQAISGGQYDAGFDNLKKLADTLGPLANLPKGGFSSVMTQLKKLPEVMGELGKLSDGDMASFRDKIREISEALKPLAEEMQQVANGFAAFPTKLQKLLGVTQRVPSTVNRISKSFLHMGLRAGTIIYIFNRVERAISKWINESNQYIENLNLFNVSMGEFADEAGRYAEKVSEVMGIDPGEWMRNQGVFQTLATGFGVAADRAYIMSKNLTQLGYDLSSFFNLSTAEAFQKLQSGLAGELEPLRRLGFDLSKARLEQEALNLGIEKSYSVMTQAEKAQLRYVAIMTQVTTAQGDMARTLNAPANQLRILRAQIDMASRSLGNIFIPLLNMILPYAIAAAKAIRFLADTIASLFGFKLPEVDYSGIKAPITGIENGTENIEDNLGGAAKKAKELKNQVMGIDELNVLQQPEDNDLGGLGDLGLGDMGGGFDFELPEYDFIGDAVNTKVDKIFKKIKKYLTDIFKFLKDHAYEIASLVASIGAGFLAWKLSGAFLKGIGQVGHLIDFLKANKGRIGFTLALAGFTLEGFGAFSIGHDGLNLKNAIMTGIGAALGIAGSLLTFGTGPLGWVIGITTSLVVAIVGIHLGERKAAEEKFWQTELGGEIKDLRDILSENAEINVDLKAKIKSITGEVDSNTLADLGAAQKLIDSIFYLDAKDNKTSTEIGMIQQKIEILNGMNLDGISGAFQNTTDGYILPARDAIQSVMDKMLEQYKMEALHDAYVEALKNQVQVEMEVERQTDALLTAEKQLQEAQDADGITAYNNALDRLKEYLKSTGVQVDDSKDSLALWNAVAEDGSGKAIQLWEELREAGLKMDDFGVATDEADKNVQTAKDNLSKLKETSKEAADKVGYLEGEMRNLVGTARSAGYDTGTEFTTGLVNSMPSDINGPMIHVPVQYEVNSSGIGYDWTGYYASGGYPETGQMFVAREAGPEMVGTIGGKTAVANNQQIVEGVSAGVEDANVQVVNALYQLIDVVESKEMTVNVGDSDIGQANDRYNSRRGVRINSSAFANAY